MLQAFSWRECQDSFCEKLSEASPVSESPSAIWLQGWAHQWCCQHLCNDEFRKTEVLKTEEKRTAWREGEICERNNPADTKVSETGGKRRCSSCQMGDSPAVVKIMVKQTIPLWPVEVHGGADIHLHVRADGYQKEGCNTMGSPHWSGFPAGLMAPWREEGTLE